MSKIIGYYQKHSSQILPMHRFFILIKYFISAFIILHFCSCFSTKWPSEDISEQMELGKCYVSLMEKNENERYLKTPGFVIEITEPDFIESSYLLTTEELNNHFQKNGRVSLLVKKSYANFSVKEGDLRALTSLENPKGFMLCYIDVPSEYKMYHLDSIQKMNYKIPFIKRIKSASIKKKYVRNQPKKLSKNQYFFSKSKWYPLREAVGGNGCRSYTAKQFEEKLLELGYDVDLNNRLDEKEKDALKHFQKKHGLKVGQLDHDTLRELGIIN